MSVRSVAKKENIASIVVKHGGAGTNTGLPEVQVALLTDRIKFLTEHLKIHKKDFSTQRGLLKLVGHRRRLLDFMKGTAPQRYLKLLGTLELRK